MTNANVRAAMTAPPSAIESEASVVEAARLMLTENVGSLPVVDDEVLVGIVTDRDLVTEVVARDLDPSKVTVSDVCSDDPVVARPEESLDAVLQRMAEEQIQRLPVVQEGRLVGILAQADVARTATPESTGRMVERISEY
jgi:CBS domain-containing protein